MEKIITEIKKEMEKQGVSTYKLAELTGLSQQKVFRISAGINKRIDADAINKITSALGMVADPQEVYGGGPRFQVVQEIAETTKPSSPIAAAILGIVEAMSPEEQAEALKQLTDQFTASRLKEKS